MDRFTAGAQGTVSGGSERLRVVGICGLGLIGSSAARALTGQGVEVLGLDLDSRIMDEALKFGVRPVASTDEMSGVDLMMLAAPTGVNAQILARLQESGLRVPTMDLGSAKSPIVEVWRADSGRFPFVATHPMAGSQLSGVGAGSADLFVGAAWPVVIDELTDPEALIVVLRAVLAFGAFPVPVTAAIHDAVVAEVSHLPHLLAGALGRVAATEPHRTLALRLAAGSFRDISRVCASPPARTAEFVAANARCAAERARLASAELLRAARYLDDGDIAGLQEWLKSAHEARLDLEQLERSPGESASHASPADLRSHMAGLVDTGSVMLDLRGEGPGSWASTWSAGAGQ
ncbi:MAG: prephenate dehydrogenase/arogenate dehydrogenase family protein [Candidatus Nanopelagicales bacterium]|nr:prephenate dehydrogenase/arogenate dehydrogenase family protein [Candidatus Nanopelagicales bacterium]